MSFLRLSVILGLAVAGGCTTTYHKDKATRYYPRDLHRPESVDIEVFRDGTAIQIVNSTPVSYYDFDLWVNQRFTSHLEMLSAGQTINVSLWDFYDVRGERFSAGGFWQTTPPMPVRMVELQDSETEPMVGLVMVVSDGDK